jgi:hypothetical protein
MNNLHFILEEDEDNYNSDNIDYKTISVREFIS